MILPRKRRAAERGRRCRRPQPPPPPRSKSYDPLNIMQLSYRMRGVMHGMVTRDPASRVWTTRNKDQLLQDEITSSVSQLATKVQGASFRGWKEVTSMFNKDDEQQLLEKCKSPKFKGTNLRIKEDVKTEKKSGFWDSLVLKQNMQSKKPDEIEGWEPPQITLEDPATDVGDSSRDHLSWPGWEEETKGSTKYTNLSSSGNSSRWSIKSAGKLVSIRRQSKARMLSLLRFSSADWTRISHTEYQ
ncbi:testis development-related protein isoform X2 [Notamacropus eugenii]|uniref:testis development-related protein isoform X2 n=1 Tax=Notamacropus eugenii TaxID=9315 RepID=UPI003B67547E